MNRIALILMLGTPLVAQAKDPYAGLGVTDGGSRPADAAEVELTQYARPAVPKDLTGLRPKPGVYPGEFLRQPALSAVVAAQLADPDAFFRSLDTTSENVSVVDERYVVGQGCQPHLCGQNQSLFVFDLRTGALWALNASERTGKPVTSLRVLALPTAELGAGAQAAVDGWLATWQARLSGGQLVKR